MKRAHGFSYCAVAALLATIAILCVCIANYSQAFDGETWRGLVIAPEHRCAPYDRDDYPYSRSVEAEIVATMGGIVYGPYSGRHYSTTRQTDIEHIVAVSEAHDSGLCAADQTVRRRFASDLLNLTLAAPELNRCSGSGKCAHDAAEWLPPRNRCWFAARIVAVKRAYALTVDRRETAALEQVISGCESTEMIITAAGAGASNPPSRTASASDVLALYDDNRNGRITCVEARSHGIAPVPRDHPAYPFMRDGDGDGVVCE